MASSTQDLIDRARQGDKDAFLEIFEEARPMVFRVAYRMVGPNDAEDVTMDAYIKAWKAFPGFTGRAEPRTWISRIAHNCAVDHLRRRKTWASASDPTGTGPCAFDPGALPDTAQRSPADAAADAETESRIQAALETLAPEHRVTLLLRLTDGLSYAQIAAATGVSIGTVMSRLFNGRRKLMKLLAGLKGEVS